MLWTSLLNPSKACDLFVCGRMITLRVHSSLSAVGLTAAVSTALSAAGVPCNVVAAFFHDHLFVPSGRAGEAIKILQDLSRDAKESS